MAHGKLRSDNTCLNCGTTLQGRFCHVCGQENLEPKDSLLGLSSHFINDLTHFDGKFFISMKDLLTKPGFLTKEYMVGRRARYLNPIRMYFFTSAVFFLIALSSDTNKDMMKVNQKNRKETLAERQTLLEALNKSSDTATVNKVKRKLDRNAESLITLEQMGAGGVTPLLADSTRKRIEEKMKAEDGSEKKKKEETRSGYDSVQASLPKEKRDGWLATYYHHKKIDINTKFRESKQEFVNKMIEKFIHSIPKMMFVSLPLVALIFMLLYIRRRKEFFYVNHLIHVFHVFIAIYLFTLVTYFFGWLFKLTEWSLFEWLNVIVVLYIFYYIYKSMRNFYGQSRRKTVVKFAAMLVLVSILFLFLSVAFVVNSLLAA